MEKKSLAIAYALKRKAKKMAAGGEVEEMKDGYVEHEGDDVKMNHAAKAEDEMYAEGGEVDDQDMIGRVMKSRYSKGGQVANDVGIAEAEEMPAEYDDVVLRDDDMEGADYTPENSGDEIGNEGEDARRSDIVIRVMKSRAKTDRMPRPA